MAINSLDTLLVGMKKSLTATVIKTSVTAVLGHEMSLWRVGGFPPSGGVPASPSPCSNATVGAFPLAPRSTGEDRILAQVSAQLTTIGTCLFVEDRLLHMGGLDGTVITPQTVNLSLYDNLGNNNLSQRMGATDYSEVDWYLEWYIATGATSVTPSLSITHADGTTGTGQIYALGSTALPASVTASRRYKIYSTVGKPIRSIESITLSASTGTAGNFGVTAVRKIAMLTGNIANVAQTYDWSYLCAPLIYDETCLSFGLMPATSSTGNNVIIFKQAVA